LPNIKSAKKRVLVTAILNERNRAAKSAVKTKIKKFEQATGEEAKAAYTEAVKAIDKAAANGVMHKNTAARRKSSLARKLNAAQ